MSRADSLLVLAAAALAGASSSSAAQTAAFATSVRPGMPGVDSLVMAMLWAWIAISAVAVVVGLAGGYRALRSGVLQQPLLLMFFGLYTLTLRVDYVSLGWPWQFHLGMIMGRIGLGVNIVGAALLVWYVRVCKRHAAASPARAVDLSTVPEAITEPAS